MCQENNDSFFKIFREKISCDFDLIMNEIHGGFYRGSETERIKKSEFFLFFLNRVGLGGGGGGLDQDPGGYSLGIPDSDCCKFCFGWGWIFVCLSM